MSGAVWVRDRLRAAGWRVEIADARKVKAIAPLACKTDKVDARVLAELCRRDLVPAVWVPSLSDRGLRERLNRRAHLIRLRTAARNRVFGALTQRNVNAGRTGTCASAGPPPGCSSPSNSSAGSSASDLATLVIPLERRAARLAHQADTPPAPPQVSEPVTV